MDGLLGMGGEVEARPPASALGGLAIRAEFVPGGTCGDETGGGQGCERSCQERKSVTRRRVDAR